MNYVESPRNRWHKIAVSISRKHDKRASWRNLYRRTIYDALLPYLKAPTIKHFDCVLLLKKGLKLERAVPEAWIQDAKVLFEKNTTR